MILCGRVERRRCRCRHKMVHNFFLQLVIGQRFLQNLREALEDLVHIVVNIQLREGERAKVALGVHLLAAAHLTPALGQEADRQCRRLTPYSGRATCLMMLLVDSMACTQTQNEQYTTLVALTSNVKVYLPSVSRSLFVQTPQEKARQHSASPYLLQLPNWAAIMCSGVRRIPVLPQPSCKKACRGLKTLNCSRKTTPSLFLYCIGF